jgi:hypothetical protein
LKQAKNLLFLNRSPSPTVAQKYRVSTITLSKIAEVMGHLKWSEPVKQKQKNCQRNEDRTVKDKDNQE